MKSTGSAGDAITDINITPFVDVVLVLLVIFIVTAPMLFKQVIDIKLPPAASSTQTAPDTLGLAVTATGQLLLNGKTMTAAEVKDFAARAVQQNKMVQVVIAADSEAAHKHVIKAIDIIKQAGVENFAFQVSRKALQDD